MLADAHTPTHERAAQELSAQVVARRKLLDLRREDLADLAQVSHRFVQSLEAGKATVRLDKVTAARVQYRQARLSAGG